MTTTGRPDTDCPRCSTPLVTERAAAAWCPSCEWNLDLYEPERHRPEQGWRWFDRLTHRIAYRLTRNQYTALAGRTVDRPGWGGARICLLVASVVLLAGVVGMFLFGVYLVVDGFPSWWMLPGGFLILLAIALRPRLGRLDPSARPLTRDEAATLFRLIDDVAAAIGTPAPHVVAVDSEFNAQAGVIGLGRRVLTIGLPLWGVLPPQQRVALVGHELGHFSNGDVRRGPLIGIAFTTLGKLSELLRPPYSPTGEHSFAIGESLTRGVMSICGRSC